MLEKSDSKDTALDLADELKAIQKTKIFEDIAAQIKQLIDSGKLKPGDRLPPERDLSEIFKVSRHSVREAMRVLEQERLVKSIPGSGTYISITDKKETVDLISAYLIQETDKLIEIFQLRRIIEPQMAGLAATNATDDDIFELETIIERQHEVRKEKRPSRNALIKIDNDFHRTIARATKNSIILKIIERVNDIFYESRKEIYQSDFRARISARGHIEIIETIKKRDKKMAVVSMEKHLKSVENIVLKNIVPESQKRKKEASTDTR